MSRLGSTLIALLLAACQGASTVTPHPLVLPGSSTLAIGESVALDGSPYALRLDAIASDSRCPTDVTCVWAGEVTVRATLQSAPGVGAPDHQIVLRQINPVVAAGLSLRITEVRPPAGPSGSSPPAADYHFTVVIERVT